MELIAIVAVSAIVSFTLWLGLEIIPVLLPRETGRIIAHLKPTPRNIIEINHYITLLIHGKTWQRFMALDVIRELFISNINQLELLKHSQWRDDVEVQKELMERRELSDDEILHIEAAKKLLKGPDISVDRKHAGSLYLNRDEEEFIRLRNKEKDYIDDLRKKYSHFRVWAPRNRDLLKYIQERVFVNRELDVDSLESHSQEWALVNLWGFEPPEKYSADELIEDLILYIDIEGGDGIVNKLAIALSDHENSLRYLDEVLSRVSAWKTGGFDSLK